MCLAGWTPAIRPPGLPSFASAHCALQMQLAAPPRERAGKTLRCLRSTVPVGAAELALAGARGAARSVLPAPPAGGAGLRPPRATAVLGAGLLPLLRGPGGSLRKCPHRTRLPRPSRCRAPAGTGWTPVPPLRGPPANRLWAICQKGRRRNTT